jgi:hypothetical protein
MEEMIVVVNQTHAPSGPELLRLQIFPLYIVQILTNFSRWWQTPYPSSSET